MLVDSFAPRPDGLRAPDEADAARAKIRTLDDVAKVAENARASGKRVVQCHGTFDLLHLGHVRHLSAARRLGDVLVVTVTADRFVNKGPGRPVFSAEMRAEMLATVQYVDWVAINESEDAVSAIERIRPDVYVKGNDYESPEGDVTGKIVAERHAVEAHGGRLHFTNEVTFSSSGLINEHFSVFEPHVREHLDLLRENGALEDLVNLIERVRDYRVLLVGDAIIDVYQYVLPMGKTPKEYVIATRYQDEEAFAGGVFAAANHVASFCREVDVITCVGDDDEHQDLVRSSLKPNVRLKAFERHGSPTTFKRRFIDPTTMRKLFEVYLMNDDPLPQDLQREIDSQIGAELAGYDVVIVTDFGHGLLASSSVDVLTKASTRFLAVNTQSNSANLGYNLITRYPRADYICIDAPEARLAAGDRVSTITDIAGRLAAVHVDCPRIIITHGKNGCVTYGYGELAHTIPAFAGHIVDTVGAGDAFFAVTAPLLAAGASVHQAGFVGNVVGALKVEIVGHRRSVDKVSLIKGIKTLLQ
jgi:rfaE bifunctional protein nucleotidyltransferase chain/domain